MTKAIELQLKTAYGELNLAMNTVGPAARKELFSFLSDVFQVPKNEIQKAIFDIGKDAAKPPKFTADHPKREAVVKLLTKAAMVEAQNAEVAEVENSEIDDEPLFKPEYPKESSARKLPLLNSERSSMVSLGDKLQDALNQKEDIPEHWKTGKMVKIFDGEEEDTYKCRYKCPICGDKGNHYIRLGEEYIRCRGEDHHELEVMTATPNVDENGIPERDRWGNFYTAGTYNRLVGEEDGNNTIGR